MLGIYVLVSKGTYIRSLAHDLGQTLGVGAYLESLIRTRHGPFAIEGATTLEGLEEAFGQGTWRELLFPPEYILTGWPVHTATPEEEADIRQGRPLRAPAPVSRADMRMMAVKTAAGDILAVAEWDGDRGLWLPKKVFPAAEQQSQR
jgi:tRNA pseudouridine55 synthase